MHQIDLAPSILSHWRGPTANGIVAARTALLVLDLQVGFLDEKFPGCVSGVLDIIPNVNRLAHALRTAGAKIVFTRHTIVDEAPNAPPRWQMNSETFGPVWNSLRPGARGHPLHAGLEIDAIDLVVDKFRYSALLPNSSPLNEILQAENVDTVVIAGAVANICCESTARDANMLDYEVIFVADATAATEDALHNASLANMTLCFANVKTTRQILDNIITGQSPETLLDVR